MSNCLEGEGQLKYPVDRSPTVKFQLVGRRSGHLQGLPVLPILIKLERDPSGNGYFLLLDHRPIWTSHHIAITHVCAI